MWYVVAFLACVSVFSACFALYNKAKMDRLETKIINLALKLNETNDMIQRMDDANGIALHEIRKIVKDTETKLHEQGLEFETFKNLYGEAAVEELRQAAKAEKAWAEGLNGIMSYGAALQGRGDKK